MPPKRDLSKAVGGTGLAGDNPGSSCSPRCLSPSISQSCGQNQDVGSPSLGLGGWKEGPQVPDLISSKFCELQEGSGEGGRGEGDRVRCWGTSRLGGPTRPLQL